jgi:hypothetical protein
MRSPHKQALAALIVSAVVTFAVLYGRNAKANIVYTVPGAACKPSAPIVTICPIAGGAPIANGLSTVYFDFQSIGSGKVTTSIVWRQTYTGTIVLASSGALLDAGVHETWVSCDSLNANRSVWDYYFAGVVGDAATNVNTVSSLFGIGVWAL